MGLSLEVGILADLREADPEGATMYREYFGQLNMFLDSLGMESHQEPENCEVWSADMYGYSGLHYLRRLAAHLDATAKLPSPGTDDSDKDPVLSAYFSDVVDGHPGFVKRLLTRRPQFARRFDHLIVHSDAEGFYLPADFPKALIAPSRFEIPGAMVGSVPRLLDELSRISDLLGISETLNSQSDELWEAVESQGEGQERWQRYAIESYSCVVLREGCRFSMATGAALVFV